MTRRALLVLPCLYVLTGAVLVRADEPLPAFVPKAPTASIIVYRPANTTSAGLPLNLDGQRVADMRRGQFVTLTVAPGKHYLQGKTKDGARELVATAGQVYYFKYTLTIGWRNLWELAPVVPEQAVLDIAGFVEVPADGRKH